jgi:hypothetical protein
MMWTELRDRLLGSRAAALAFAGAFTGASSVGSTTAPTPQPTANVAPMLTKAPSRPDSPFIAMDERLAH